MPPHLTLSIIRYKSRVKWSNSRKDVAPFPTPRYGSCWKGSLRFTLDYSRQLYFFYLFFGLVGRVFASDPGDQGSIPFRDIPKTQKMLLDTSLLNAKQYKVRIKGKVEQLNERSSALPYTSVWWPLKKEPSDHPRLRSPNLLTFKCFQVLISNTNK